MRSLLRLRVRFFVWVLGLASLWACAPLPPQAEAVQGFVLDRYVGTWYELARFDHSFERGLENVSAVYTPQDKGRVGVLNRGFDSATGKWKEARAVARFRGDASVGDLEVSFFRPFYGRYAVIALDPDYTWAIVSGGGNYLWLLSRTPTVSDSLRQDLIQRARDLGFDPARLLWVWQDPGAPAPAR
jgi:apolipoprotein D and lipocalin family protein